MSFDDFCDLLAKLRATGGRNAKIAAVAELLQKVDASELRSAVAFLAGRPFPAADPRVLDVSWNLVREAESRASGEASGLAIADVAAAFEDIAAISGKGSQKARIDRLAALFSRASKDARRAIGGIVVGMMRTGVGEGLLLEAIAKASGVKKDVVKRAAMFLSDLADVALLAREGEAALAAVKIEIFRPVLPMLAEPSDGVADAWEQHEGKTALEVKYDGARIQAHKDGDVVRVWSRRLTELTASVPEVVEVLRGLKTTRAIFDGEVLAVGPNGRPYPFQEVMRRLTREVDVGETATKIPLEPRLFDCLVLDGEPLVDRPYAERWELLARATEGKWLAHRVIAQTAEEGQALLERALADGHEGLMAKRLDGLYAPGNRGSRWLKIKVPDTVDCVVIAVDRGSGRREGWLSNYHLAVRDEDGRFLHVGKTFKGLTDAEHKAMTERFHALASSDDGYTITLKPEVVVEVTYNDIQKSNQYPSGFALRFARVTRIRDDKRADQASTIGELRDRFDRQFTRLSRPDW